jgi:hypothetical protein
MLVKRSYKELEQMSQADGTGPTTVTRKRKRGSGFKYSTKKALERSKLSKEKAQGRVLALGSVRKALTYPSELLSDIGIVDLAECSPGSSVPASLHSVYENEEERIDVSIGLGVADTECLKKVTILIVILD